jgi:hypothetical protein
MNPPGSVRASRDGDQYHYHWAARQCLKLLPGTSDLVAVTIEGASTEEAEDGHIEHGEELIDVGLYFGNESRDQARLIHYIQLKHSTLRSNETWTASGLKKTIQGFAERYKGLRDKFSVEDVAQRFRFEFTTNRPIDSKLQAVFQDIAQGRGPSEPNIHELVMQYCGLDNGFAAEFFRLFAAAGEEEDLWEQKNMLHQDTSVYLPDADYDAPGQLKELVARKATTQFKSNPSIRRHDVLRALKTEEIDLQPAICLIPDASDTLPRQQESEILRALLASTSPVVIHADGGVGKSILAARLAASMPEGSEAVLYDCFGDGLYRTLPNSRHRHREALVQMANELAARGLSYPLIPTVNADDKQYTRAFLGRVKQAVGLLRSRHPAAVLCLIIDAADNAEMAAEELREPCSFVRDLVRIPLPEGVCLALTCRSHRRSRLNTPLETQEIELFSFEENETALHLRRFYPFASDAEVSEFAYLSSSNPRVQSLALSRRLPLQVMLRQLGPEPTSVESAIGKLLDRAVAKLREEAGAAESAQIDLICNALAVLRPLIPISMLAQLSRTSEGAVRSFALELGRGILVKENSLHFLDEPTETWFHENFQPDEEALNRFINHLQPLTAQSAYAAGIIPQLLLQAGCLDELVRLAISGDGLPSNNPLEKRDVELQRLTYALKACLQQKRHMEAAKLALKAGGEVAGLQRQNNLIQANTHLAAVLMEERVEEIVSRRLFSSSWMGSHFAYNAGLLSGHEENYAEASSCLRMAMDWLRNWSLLPFEERRNEEISDEDRMELAMSIFRLRGPEKAASFLRGWQSRQLAFRCGKLLARRFIDLGKYVQLDEMARAAGNDVWLMLGLAVEAREVGHHLPPEPLERTLRLLSDRRIKLPKTQELNSTWNVLNAVRSVIEHALRVLPKDMETWAEILRRYLPATPPAELYFQYGSNRVPLIKAYALEAALRGQELTLIEIAPSQIREELEKSDLNGSSDNARVYLRECGGLLPWVVLSAKISCGSEVLNIEKDLEAAIKTTTSAGTRNYYHEGDNSLWQLAALEWFAILQDTGLEIGAETEAFLACLFSQDYPINHATKVVLCYLAARTRGFDEMAINIANDTQKCLEEFREDAEAKAVSYADLAKAIFTVSPSEARIFFNRGAEIASHIGEENLMRWDALLHLADSSGEQEKPRPQSAYRLARAAELTYEYVVRDKHFKWERTVNALAGLCGSSVLGILSRWRDRRFGDACRLLPPVIYHLQDQGQLPSMACVALAGVEAEWNRVADLKQAAIAEYDPKKRSLIAQIAYRYIRVLPVSFDQCVELREFGQNYGLNFPDISRLTAFNRDRCSDGNERTSAKLLPPAEADKCMSDWDEVFFGTNMSDANALHTAYLFMQSSNLQRGFGDFIKEALKRVSVGHQPEFVQAISTWPDFGIFELRELLRSLPSPISSLISVRQAIRAAVLSACSRTPEYVDAVRRERGALIPLEKLYEEQIVSVAEVAKATIEGFAEQLDTLRTDGLFKLVGVLATCLLPAEAEEALSFGLDLLEELLRPEDGDGPWLEELQPPVSLISSLAGYIWVGLGSPVRSERWQYAHVVRAVVELGWTDLLLALMSWAETDTPGPYYDREFEFYVWHARQWLLIGLVRGGLVNPEPMLASEPLLKRFLYEDHVLIQRLAAQALRVLGAPDEITEDHEGDFESVNCSKPLEQPDIGKQLHVEGECTPTEKLPEEAKHYFNYDIESYWLGPLGRVFNLSEQEIVQHALRVMQQRMGCNGRSGWKEDARRLRGIFVDNETSHSHYSLPRTDDLRAYHGYHAMMMVAADLLKEQTLQINRNEVLDEFREWLSSYQLTRDDEKWIADRRDPKLVSNPLSPSAYGDKIWRWGVTSQYLDQMLIGDNESLVLWGYWSGGKSDYVESVNINSALVTRSGAKALVAALQTAPSLGRFQLPRAEDDELNFDAMSMKGWVKFEPIDARLDEGDPWADGLSYPAPEPSALIISQLGLTALEDRRVWASDPEVFVGSETWTQSHGYGRERESISGWRLSGSKGFLKQLLNANPNDCIILSVEIKRPSRRNRGDQDEIAAYLQPYARYYLMEADGVAHAL